MEDRRGIQRGSAAVMAIFAMMVLGTVIVSLLSMTALKHSAGSADRDLLAARYAAEAGLKRAYAAITARSTEWNWLSNSTLVQNIPLWDGSNTTYNVSVSSAGGKTLNQGFTPEADTYTFKSTGMVNGRFAQAVTGKIQVQDNGSVKFPYSIPPDDGVYGKPTEPGKDEPVFPGPVDDPAYVHATMYGILGSQVTVYGGTYRNPVYGDEYALATTASAPGFQWGPNVTTSVTQVLLDMFDASFFSTSSSRLASYAKHGLNETINQGQGFSWNNVWATPAFPTGKHMYEVTGDVKFNCGTLTTADFPTQIVIYSHGDITVNCRMQGNFVLIADGKITLNSGQTDTGQIELYSQGDMVVNSKIGTTARPATSFGVFMTRGKLTVHGNFYNKAFMFGRAGVTHDGGGTMYGAIYSLGAITINSAMDYTFDQSVIP